MLKLKNLTTRVQDKVILDNLNLDFKTGRTYVIMGPNGSGKSTLAKSIMADPEYNYEGEVLFQDTNIMDLSPDQRAKLGMFVSFQNPVELNGINVFDLLKLVLKGKVRILEMKRHIDRLIKQLDLKPEVASQSLNQTASGGEKKKLEVIQACLLNPTLIVFDEIDTGLDVDALKQIAQVISRYFQTKDKTLIIITHYNRILRYLKPDEVLIMDGGRIVRQGGPELIDEIEKHGFKKLDLKSKLLKLLPEKHG